jgi:hypothetical protein
MIVVLWTGLMRWFKSRHHKIEKERKFLKSAVLAVVCALVYASCRIGLLLFNE